MAYNRMYTPWNITTLKKNEIFVFGSNLEGMHGGAEAIKPYVDQFIAFASSHPEYTFLVTRIGCGIAGFTAADMALLFAQAIDVENIIWPKDFVEVILSQE